MNHNDFHQMQQRCLENSCWLENSYYVLINTIIIGLHNDWLCDNESSLFLDIYFLADSVMMGSIPDKLLLVPVT